MRATLCCLIIAVCVLLTSCQTAAPAPPPTTPTFTPAVAPDQPPATIVPPRPTPVPGSADTAQLAVAVDPTGASVSIDGQPRGSAPFTLTLPAGSHHITVQAPGFISLTEAITLAAGEEGMYAPALDPVGATPEPTEPAEPVAALAPTVAASAPPTGAPPAGAPPAATPPAEAAAPAQPSPAAQGQTLGPEPVQYRVSSVIIPTYPYTPYLHTVSDPKLGGYPVPVLDRQAYEAAHPQPVPVSYTLLELENRYLRLSILPELGGRIYEVVFKPTGNNELYRNPVIKPTQWGPGTPEHPAGANWWLAAGGIEWGFPVEEHGYEWANEWGFDQATGDDGSQSVIVFTQDPSLPYVAVEITLPPDSAAFIVQPTITNPLETPFRYKWWLNAMLAPGPANKPGADLRFIIPGSQVTVHSTGDQTLPQPGQPMTWPSYAGRDLSRLGNWTSWLGFFARPAAQAGFAAVYDTGADEGLVRVFPPDIARGVKAFGPGWTQPIDPADYTDDKSAYVELHGGQAPTFDDWSELPAGGSVFWTETWYPAAGMGGLVYATADAALNLSRTGTGAQIAIFPARPMTAQLDITLPAQPPTHQQLHLTPDRPYVEALAGQVPSGDVTVKLVDTSGQTLLDYRGQLK